MRDTPKSAHRFMNGLTRMAQILGAGIQQIFPPPMANRLSPGRQKMLRQRSF